MTYYHGVDINEISTGVRPIRTASTSVIGVVGTASDCDAEKFPLNTPILINNLYDAIDDIGTNGSLYSTLKAISNQCLPQIVLIRVEEFDDETEQTASILGNIEDDNKTGLQALLDAESLLGVSPKILAVPYFDNQAVTTELLTIAEKLGAFVYASTNANSIEDAVIYRRNFDSRNLMLFYPDFLTYDKETGENIILPSSCVAIGLRAKIDSENGVNHSISNNKINGVVGISKPIFWSLVDKGSTDANYLNSNEITTIINSEGFRFSGVRTCTNNPIFAFENVVRINQLIKDTIPTSHQWAMDKPINKVLIGIMLDSINNKFREMTSQNIILGGEASMSDENMVSTLKGGKLIIDYKFTPPPLLEQLKFNQEISDTYIADLFKN